MPRARDPNRNKAFEIWKEHKGKITNRAIAEQLGVPEKTIGGWKSKDKWNGVLQTNERSTPNVKTLDKSTNRSGNPNPPNKFSHRNNPKFKHGLLSKYLHEEQIEIMDLVSDMDIADQLWYQIQIKFSAIIRMQKIMWVHDGDDHLREESGNSSGEGGSSETFKVSFAYEQYESYIKAQARAMAEYRNLVKHFLSLAHEEDERRLKIEQMQLNINKTKSEIDNMNGDEEDETINIVITRKEDRG